MYIRDIPLSTTLRVGEATMEEFARYFPPLNRSDGGRTTHHRLQRRLLVFWVDVVPDEGFSAPDLFRSDNCLVQAEDKCRDDDREEVFFQGDAGERDAGPELDGEDPDFQ